ncbi:MAG: aspartate dehydrogenase [Candidatus Altiarchaeota archaeon]
MRVKIRFGLVGCGAMGSAIAKAFDRGEIYGQLTCVFDIDVAKAKKLSTELKHKPKVVASFPPLLKSCDVIIEAASQQAVREYAPEAVKRGKSILVMSVGPLLDRNLMEGLTRAASKSGSRIYLPSGALAGVDGVMAGSCGRIEEVMLTTTKPPAGLKDAKYLLDKGIRLEGITKPMVVFEGDAQHAVKMFPKNINVSAVVSLASGRNARVRIIADPSTDRNVHEITVRGDFGEITTRTSNVPSPANPRTSHLAVLSAISVLKQLSGSVKIGN